MSTSTNLIRLTLGLLGANLGLTGTFLLLSSSRSPFDTGTGVLDLGVFFQPASLFYFGGVILVVSFLLDGLVVSIPNGCLFGKV